MSDSNWLNLCYRALDVPDDLPDEDRRRRAEHTLLERAGQRFDILGLGAAAAAIDLVVRYGDAGELDEVMLRWEQAELLQPGVSALFDEGNLKATICAKRLLGDVVAWAERQEPADVTTPPSTRSASQG